MHDLPGPPEPAGGVGDEQQATVSPFELLRVVGRHKLLVLGVTALAVALALLLALRQSKQYSSEASLLFRDPGFGNTGGSQIFGGGADPKRDTQTNIDVVGSRAVANVVRKRLRTRESADSLLQSVKVEPSEDSDVAQITAVRSDPRDAAAVANAFAEGYIEYRRTTDQALIARAQAQLRQQLPAAPAADQPGISANIQALELARIQRTGNGEVVARATPNSTPTAPRPRRNAILGFILGLLGGCALALLLERLDRRLRDEEALERAYPEYTVLAEIPNDAKASRAAVPTGATAEAYRILREGLRFLDPDGEMRCIVVTSAEEGEGKSTVARQLASTLTDVGQSVVLVESDMRRPTTSAAFDIPSGTLGLSDLLVSDERASSVLVPVRADNDLRLLSAGTTPPNPSDLLRRRRLGAVLEDLRGSASIVLIDAPPLLPVADTRTLLQAPQVDAVIIVGRAGHSTRDGARETRRVLRQSGRPVLGLVITGARGSRAGTYYSTPSKNGTSPRRPFVGRGVGDG